MREQARRLILETRVKSGGGGSIESPTSPTKPKRFNFSPERTISPIHNGADEFFAEHGKKLDHKEQPGSPSHRLSDPKGLGVKGSPLQSFNAIVDRISPKNEKRVGFLASCPFAGH